MWQEWREPGSLMGPELLNCQTLKLVPILCFLSYNTFQTVWGCLLFIVLSSQKQPTWYISQVCGCCSYPVRSIAGPPIVWKQRVYCAGWPRAGRLGLHLSVPVSFPICYDEAKGHASGDHCAWHWGEWSPAPERFPEGGLETRASRTLQRYCALCLFYFYV